MRESLILGLLGFGLGLLFALPFLGPSEFFDSPRPYGIYFGEWGLIGVVGSFLGVLGGVLGKKSGGTAMVIGGLLNLMLFAFLGLYGFLQLLPSAVLLVGGVVAVREKMSTPQHTVKSF